VRELCRLGDREGLSTLSTSLGSKGPKIMQLHNGPYSDLFITLVEYKAFRNSFTYGILNLLLPLRCVEENHHYLLSILDRWTQIGGFFPYFLQSLDANSSELLAGLCPGRVKAHEKEVREKIGSLALFPDVTDPQVRSDLSTSLLSMKGRILTLSTFYEDLKSVCVLERLMDEVAIWLSEGYIDVGLNPKRMGTDFSIKKAFQDAFSPASDRFPDVDWKSNSVIEGESVGKEQLFERSYRNVWLWVTKHFALLNQAYPHQSGPIAKSNVFPSAPWAEKVTLKWAGGRKGKEPAFSEKTLLVYNKRFSLPAWKSLWDLVAALGFSTACGQSFKLGPEFCSIVPTDASRDKVDRLSTFLQQLQLGTPKNLARELAEDIVSRLPSSEVVREVKGLRPSQQRSYGAWTDVWLPGYESSMALLPDFLNDSADLSKCSDEEHLCVTIKRDWLESFLGHFGENRESSVKDSEDSGSGRDISADGNSLPDHRLTANTASGIPIPIAIPESTAPFSEPSEFDNSGSPSMTPNRQARNQKEKLRPEIPVPHKETVASLDVHGVEHCPALSSTSFSDEEPVPHEQNVGSFAHDDVEKGPAPSSTSFSDEVPVPHEQNVGSFAHDDGEKGPAPSSTSDPRRKSKIPRAPKRSTSSAKDVLKGDSIEARRALRKRQ
jgi:hypothetical protein